MTGEGASKGLFGRISAIDHDCLHFAGAIGAAEGGGLIVFVGLEAGDALLEGRKLDDYEALKLLRSLHDLITPAACQNLAAVLGDDGRHEIGVLLIGDRIVDLGSCDPIGWHGNAPQLPNCHAPRPAFARWARATAGFEAAEARSA